MERLSSLGSRRRRAHHRPGRRDRGDDPTVVATGWSPLMNKCSTSVTRGFTGSIGLLASRTHPSSGIAVDD